MVPVMSFWPSIYNKIIRGEKLIEYRRNFPKECRFAYMYISKPVKAICGIIYFGRIHSINKWKLQYKENKLICHRIELFEQKNYRYGAEIIGFQRIEPITLQDLRTNVPNFFPPQSYILLENNIELKKYLDKKVILLDGKIKNDLTNIFPEHICKEY
ncbi:hypothetical protein [Veillonella criceti]|uniref:Uncharacterized conserved protein n=1 Tax=Veillonella criceti TaxID=103891 RepID=A0A380NMB4_9FIRM|nr:hypothetical protein [Veillonella criceti]SUP42863.1 Uncharacterized conserved protein [Veillonella criceti]